MMKEMITQYPIVFVVIFIVLGIVAYVVDELRWKLKSDEEQIKMIRSADPKNIMLGIKALHKRKKDISRYIQIVLPFLISDSIMNRITAKMILQKYYPEDYLLIEGYDGSHNVNTCREKADILLKKYKIYS